MGIQRTAIVCGLLAAIMALTSCGGGDSSASISIKPVQSAASTNCFELPPAVPSQIGVFRNGMWYLDANGNGQWDGEPTDIVYTFGRAGDIPVVGAWGGPGGMTKIGVFRDGVWYLDLNGNGVWDGEQIDQKIVYGLAGDIPVPGIYSAWTFSLPGTVRNNFWTAAGTTFGIAGAESRSKFAIDNLGINAGKHAVFLDGTWYLSYDWDISKVIPFDFGLAGDIPVLGRWDQTFAARAGVFRNGYWFLDWNGNNVWDPEAGDKMFVFGLAGDIPVVGKSWR